MTYQPHGKHLIAGERVASDRSFSSEPAHGTAHDFSVGTPDLVNRAAEAAEAAFDAYAATSREDRAAFLDAIAEELEARVDEITETAMSETGLPEPRIRSVELPRTANQLRLFAKHIRDGAYLDQRHDDAMPDRKPMPRPDLRMIQRPIGPVAVFGASNFPLAFSTAGGDTAAALAAGCPVVVKGHGAHPGTGELAAEAIQAAAERTGMPTGVFSLIQGGDRTVGQTLVQHPLVKAVGFTGSLKGGRALYDLCAQRDEPIPFFGELGSVNPMFLMDEATEARAAEIGKAWAGSLCMGAGQFCTNPGVAVVLDGSGADALRDAAKEALEGMEPQTMLTDGIASAYKGGAAAMAKESGVTAVVTTEPAERSATPFLFETDADTWMSNHAINEEVFGPLGLIVRCKDAAQMEKVARTLKGQLTITIHMDDGDAEAVRSLLPIVERKAGRILVNGFPTGVEVADAMVHGGPYPASTNFGHTSVGTLSIRRFLRPVCFQNLPEAVLPADLKG
ncbi:NADP-dependent aldehyde dehydrogenase [Palleronia marisminoris]|uniref:NADP-dependent fatty aldehyde dehydrogenase n=1 Tax=Palleronia marisminoris TaxID=315423 RepID=A0A1Y5TK66_9RHOB|nr:aldehyde dehydrogenase (NADP(+)) [Palleronia marisminoris]SFH41771.1 NADP-dependent aldehyde dehydrogenase [Palleronia marisminoris]SLN65842.1 NADP-dependent fatty aldehyde dehydrogenase [Palleronia marisminoris]